MKRVRQRRKERAAKAAALLSCLPLRGSGDSTEESRIWIHNDAFQFIGQNRGKGRCRQTLCRIA